MTVMPREFSMTGTFAKFDDEFFETDPPLVQSGEAEKIAWATTLEDGTGVIDVKVWDKAFYELTGITASKFRALWEKGVEDVKTRREIIEELNMNLESKYLAACSCKVWSFGSKDRQYQVQVSVNLVEMVEE